MNRWILILLFTTHGVAHLPGFLANWRIWNPPDLPYRTAIWGGAIDLGAWGIRALGVAWLAACLLCLASAGMAFAEGPRRLAWLTVALSTILCAVGLPDSRIGIGINAMLIAVLLLP